jgi:hypothetical protein
MFNIICIGAGLVGVFAGFLIAYFLCKKNNQAAQTPARAQAEPIPPTREGPDSSYFEKLIRYILCRDRHNMYYSE